MKGDPEERAAAVGRYIVESGATVRAAHKVFIPADVILTFHRYTVLYFLLYYTVPPCAAQDAVCKYLRRVASPPRR